MSTPKKRVGRIGSDTKLYEETWNAASNLPWQSVSNPCRIVFENCRCSWNRSSWRSHLKICLFSENFLIVIAHHQGHNDGGQGGIIPLAPNHCGGPKSHNNFISTSFNAVHLLPKDLRFEHGGAKLASCPGRHLTSLRSCTSRLSSLNVEICLQNTCPSVRNCQSQTI